MNNKKIVFIGDSLTECFDFKKHFPTLNIINEGVSGYTTIDILNKLEEALFNYNPDIVFLLIGANDLELTNLTNDEIIFNIKKIVELMKERLPAAKLFLQSIYPVDYEIKPFSVGKRRNEDIIYINSEIKNISGVKYINMYNVLKTSEGKLNPKYTYDGLHMSELGYEVIKEHLNKYLNL